MSAETLGTDCLAFPAAGALARAGTARDNRLYEVTEIHPGAEVLLPCGRLAFLLNTPFNQIGPERGDGGMDVFLAIVIQGPLMDQDIQELP